LKRSIKNIHLAPTLLFLLFASALLRNSEALGADKLCSIFDAEYKPHKVAAGRENPKSRDLDFRLTIRPPDPEEKGGSHRTRFFYFDAFERETGRKVSTLRLADVCSNGIVRCGLDAEEGQFNPTKNMKELKAGIGFEPIALTRDFTEISYAGPQAPYVFIFPDTEAKFYYYDRPFDSRFQSTVDEFVKFHTKERIFPDFGGYDVWILTSCAGEAAK